MQLEGSHMTSERDRQHKPCTCCHLRATNTNRRSTLQTETKVYFATELGGLYGVHTQPAWADAVLVVRT